MYITHTQRVEVYTPTPHRPGVWCALHTPCRGWWCTLHTHTKKGSIHYTMLTEGGVHYTPHTDGGVYTIPHTEEGNKEVCTIHSPLKGGVHYTPHTEKSDVHSTLSK